MNETATGLAGIRYRLAARYRDIDWKFQSVWSDLATSARTELFGLKPLYRGLLTRLRHRVNDIPLIYKLSLLITVLVIICMGLLGSIIIQQQTKLFEDQLNEQGTTLARLMAKSAKEPLLAGDQLALDGITTGYATSGSIAGTAIVTLEGEIVSHTGRYHDGSSIYQTRVLKQLMGSEPGSQIWKIPAAKTTSTGMVISFVQPVTFQKVIVGYTMVTISKSGMAISLKKAKQAIIGATILIILLGIAMAFALGKQITVPIDELVDASRAIGKGVYTKRFKERRTDEIGQLMNAFNDMAEGMLEKSQVQNALSRYVSPGVAQEILSNLDVVELGGKSIDATVLFADIVGFTQIAEKMKPEELVSILNDYFSLITNACELNNGTVDKYMGDGVMLVFGAPQPDEDHAFHAVSCALLIQRLIEHENEQRREKGLFPVQFRIGANSGKMLAGNMGSRERMEYTVVGDTVNLASRLCGIANKGQIVVSRDMYMVPGVKERVLAGEYQSIQLRGIKDPVSTYLIEDLTADWQTRLVGHFNQITRTAENEYLASLAS
ncbi:MAG: HAMP domain-containing protein [Gammaproteobacteria bacterium]|nr:HAMP domain-containing protein [Gammaproteobacteria bacterium]